MPIERKGGLDDLKKAMQEIAQEKKGIPIKDLMTDRFIREVSSGSFSSLDELLESGRFSSIPDDESSMRRLDVHIERNTRFSGWNEMLNEAAKRFAASHVRKKLGLNDDSN